VNLERHSIETVDGQMTLLTARPTSTPLGAVIVIQEAFGLTDHIGDICVRLAEAGFVAVAPALFHRQPSQVVGYDAMGTDEGVALIMDLLGSLTAEGLAMDLDATLATLAAEGFDASETAIIGFCMGGAVALFAGTRPGVSAAVSFYGGGVEVGRFGLPPLVDLAPSLRCDWLGLYGDLDTGIPITQVDALSLAASSSSANTEVVRYPDAGHGFNCNDRPDHFNADAAADAWARTLQFLREHLSH